MHTAGRAAGSEAGLSVPSKMHGILEGVSFLPSVRPSFHLSVCPSFLSLLRSFLSSFPCCLSFRLSLPSYLPFLHFFLPFFLDIWQPRLFGLGAAGTWNCSHRCKTCSPSSFRHVCVYVCAYVYMYMCTCTCIMYMCMCPFLPSVIPPSPGFGRSLRPGGRKKPYLDSRDQFYCVQWKCLPPQLCGGHLGRVWC